MGNTRICWACSKVQQMDNMRRAQGHKQRYLCASCPEPQPRMCPLCGTKSVARSGLCHTHNERWRRWGKPPLAEWIAATLAGTTNNCCICGKGFAGYHGVAVCSRECDMEWRRRKALERWYALPPEEKEQAAERNLRRMREKAAARKVEVVCAACGATFRGQTWNRACSPGCREVLRQRYQEQYREDRKESRRIPKEARTCDYCGSEFLGHRHERNCGAPMCLNEAQRMAGLRYRSRKAMAQLLSLEQELSRRMERENEQREGNGPRRGRDGVGRADDGGTPR